MLNQKKDRGLLDLFVQEILLYFIDLAYKNMVQEEATYLKTQRPVSMKNLLSPLTFAFQGLFNA